MRTNLLSNIGRLSHGTLWLLYPGVIATYALWYKPKQAADELEAKRESLRIQSDDVPVDPDLFNPFSAIPFHNNPELKYIYGD